MGRFGVQLAVRKYRSKKEQKKSKRPARTHLLRQRGTHNVGGQDCRQGQGRQQLAAPMPKHPVDQTLVRLLDVRLEHGQHIVRHAADERILPVLRTLLTLATLRIVLLQDLLLQAGGRLLRDHERRLHGQTARTADQIVAVQKVERIVEALLTERGQYFRLRREEDAPEPVNVFLRQLDAGVGPVDVKHLRAVVARADVTLATERADRDRVLVQCGQIVGERTVHVAHAMEAGRQQARKHRYETRTQ